MTIYHVDQDGDCTICSCEIQHCFCDEWFVKKSGYHYVSHQVLSHIEAENGESCTVTTGFVVERAEGADVDNIEPLIGCFLDLKGTRCMHEYDCCGQWYAGRAEVKPMQHLYNRFYQVTVVQGHSMNV